MIIGHSDLLSLDNKINKHQTGDKTHAKRKVKIIIYVIFSNRVDLQLKFDRSVSFFQTGS